ncbi:efflux RND transporter periplasmic adaptor subunit [Schlesneria paludicola]|uniref:efflux RND transporter periplasmic adaptor subunit n=1 Tax=Schlesneria paludicola TaxID=360056 RepID=UPI00029A70F3|nr:hypothetical protein [Schlesneria paludicola]
MSHKLKLAAVATGILVVGGVAAATRDSWLPLLNHSAAATASSNDGHAHDHEGHDHHDHEKSSLSLSEQARTNLGLETGKIELQDWWRSIPIPGIVSEQPGHSERRITTSLNGIIGKVFVFPGQTVHPGDPLFSLQLTGELLTTTQASLLRTLQELELLEIEMKRITPLVESNALPAKAKLEKDYEKKRLESQRLIQMQELLVRGLAPEQITHIIETKTLIREFTIRVPGGQTIDAEAREFSPGSRSSVIPIGLLKHLPDQESTDESKLVYTIEAIGTFPGKLVQPGDELCDLALHTKLDIVGNAFEKEAPIIAHAIQERWPVRAIFEVTAGDPLIREDLKIRFAENTIDTVTRTLRFHIPLVNEVMGDQEGDHGIVYRSWRFKPGQKVRLMVPLEHLKQQIVLPADAVVKEGADAYVFRVNGKLLERVPVQLEFLDSREAVLKRDRSLAPGDFVAFNQAYQLNLALKKSQGGGGGGHSHEGHNH